MASKIVVGPLSKGLRNDVVPFNIDNESFPTLLNAYQHRLRIKRKRGTQKLDRLTRFFDSGNTTYGSIASFALVGGAGNLITGFALDTLAPNANLVPGSVHITDTVTNVSYFDDDSGTLDQFGEITGASQAPLCEITSTAHNLTTGFTVTIFDVGGMTELNGNTYTITVTGVNTFTLDGVDSQFFGAYTTGGYWISVNATNFGTINYSTGAITINAGGANTVSAFFLYYPSLPVMGLEELILTQNVFPQLMPFDTRFSYQVDPQEQTDIDDAYPTRDVTFYKNPSTGTYTNYVQKTNWTAFHWNGQDYQQFYTVNYQGAIWATNGITMPFSITNIGMHYKLITAPGIVNIVAGPPATADITITAHGLVIGDFVFINEVVGVTGINFQTGYVTAVPDPNTITVTFPNATLGGAWVSGGIVQYLTNVSDANKDCIRWYDGDPTNSSATAPLLTTTKGWVNFCPPLSQFDYSISDLPLDQYYLVGARIIVPFKDRLCFFGPVVQTSAVGSQVYLQDTVIIGLNGTPYYTASFTNVPDPTVDTPTDPDTEFHGILIPTNQTAYPPGYFEDSTGFGIFVQAGIDQKINTVSSNEDVLIVGFDREQSRFVYTGNDILPFTFFTINSEYGSSSTFSTINTDPGVITIGSRGLILSSQNQVQRIDLPILDQIFQIRREDNGVERITAQRDFINEWIYFAYSADSTDYKFNNQTLFYNYREDTWGLFNECYTTYGQFRIQTGDTWATIGQLFPTWASWNVPWNAGSTSVQEPLVVGGNQQGYIMILGQGTGEGESLYISDIDVAAAATTITSPDHTLNSGDFIKIDGALGTIAQYVNGKTFLIDDTATNTFTIVPPIDSSIAGLTYLGSGEITRWYVPYIQTKQFPTAWEMARKTRLGVQQYLFTKTTQSEISLLIFLSQNAAAPYNQGPIVPSLSSTNDSLIYSTTLYTCPESTNLGLTPANTNLQMPTATAQAQIWHRMNTSLIGDTVQIGFTMNREQMQNFIDIGDPLVITAISQTDPAVITVANPLSAKTMVRIDDVEGMTELNGNIYQVIASTATDITINVDSSGFGAYVFPSGTVQVVSNVNQTAEIELHGFILDTSPSMVLA